MNDFDIIVSLIKNILPLNVQEYCFSNNTKLKEDLGMDSMNLAELLLELESEFEIDLTSVLKNINIETIGDAVKAVSIGKVKTYE